MNEQLTPIGEEDLHAYVDGTLSDGAPRQVERALEQTRSWPRGSAITFP